MFCPDVHHHHSARDQTQLGEECLLDETLINFLPWEQGLG